MTSLSELKDAVGELPEGFSLVLVERGQPHFRLCYNGPDFEQLIEVSGKKPAPDAEHAIVYSCSVSWPVKDAVKGIREVIKET